MGSKLKFRWVLCFIIFSLVLLIYGNHLFKERAKKMADMRRAEAVDFMDDGWKKYRMMQFAGANMEYTDSKGNIRVIETEPVLLDVFDEAIKPYILGKTPSLGSFRITEGKRTSEFIQTFNDNMKHIRLWNYAEEEYNTITETERITEFTDVKNINELWEYLSHEKVEGVSNMGALDTIGYDGTEQPTKIIYDYGNGKINIITESGTLSLGILFENYLKDI